MKPKHKVVLLTLVFITGGIIMYTSIRQDMVKAERMILNYPVVVLNSELNDTIEAIHDPPNMRLSSHFISVSLKSGSKHSFKVTRSSFEDNSMTIRKLFLLGEIKVIKVKGSDTLLCVYADHEYNFLLED